MAKEITIGTFQLSEWQRGVTNPIRGSFTFGYTDVWTRKIKSDTHITSDNDYVQIKRTDNYDQILYEVFFAGKLKTLASAFAAKCPETTLKFDVVQAALDFVDDFLLRMNKLIVFI